MALRAAGLVVATRQGRHQLYTADADALAATLSPWLARYEAFFATALTRLREVVMAAEHGGPPGGASTMDSASAARVTGS
jgi:hypothetical protein